jgi:hypothetical protein
VQNVDQTYDLLPAEKAYLAGIGLPTPVVDAWLAQMNARPKIEAKQSARNYVRNNTDFNGKIRNPILSVTRSSIRYWWSRMSRHTRR